MSEQRRLMSHLVAGFPTLRDSREIAEGLIEAGSAYLEVQFPYSDPTADGPAIQAACSAALEGGFRVDSGFELVAELSARHDTPIFIMSYGGTVYARGVERFVDDAVHAGATGLIVPDLMPGYDEGLFEFADARGIAAVPVVAPSIGVARLDRILALESPFLYAAIRIGTTGQRSEIDDHAVEFLRKLRRDGTILIAGFGVSDAKQARDLQEYTDVLVVGTALVRAVQYAKENGMNMRAGVSEKARELIGGTVKVEEEKAPDRRRNT